MNRRLALRLGALLAGALTLGMAATAHAAAPSFSGPTTAAVGVTPSAVAVGDFNGDGKRDLVVANFGSDTASILLGNGNGTFAAASSVTGSMKQPQAVATGDLNGDGKADLAVVNNQTGTVSILLGTGTGTFTSASPATVTVGTKPTGVAIANLNGDAFPDLAVTNAPSGNNNGTVSILLGNGNGTFTAGTAVNVAKQPSAVLARDLNGDGKVDLVVANQGSNTVSVALGNNNGTFGTPSSIAVGTGPTALAVGDLNGDGKLDLAVTNGGAGTVSVLLGDGSGGFSAASGSPVTVGNAPSGVAMGDLNGDGLADLAVTNAGTSNTVSVLPGNGNGTFGTAVTLANGASTAPAGIALGDFDNDGRTDLAVVNAGNATAGIYMNTTTIAPTTIALSVGAASLDFGNLAIGATSSPVSASVGVTTNDAAGYTLSVTRSTFSGGDIPVSLTPLGVTTGATFDFASASAVPTSGSLGIGRRLTATSGAGDAWQFSLALGPVPFVQDGPHSSTLTFTALGL